jgi:hypothetical protein
VPSLPDNGMVHLSSPYSVTETWGKKSQTSEREERPAASDVWVGHSCRTLLSDAFDFGFEFWF